MSIVAEKKETNNDQQKQLSVGNVAYNAYCEKTNWKSLVSGADLPQYENLKPEIQEAWEASGNCILNIAKDSVKRAVNEISQEIASKAIKLAEGVKKITVKGSINFDTESKPNEVNEDSHDECNCVFCKAVEPDFKKENITDEEVDSIQMMGYLGYKFFVKNGASCVREFMAFSKEEQEGYAKSLENLVPVAYKLIQDKIASFEEKSRDASLMSFAVNTNPDKTIVVILLDPTTGQLSVIDNLQDKTQSTFLIKDVAEVLVNKEKSQVITPKEMPETVQVVTELRKKDLGAFSELVKGFAKTMNDEDQKALGMIESDPVIKEESIEEPVQGLA